jgi:hypothetical protein
MGVPPCSLFYCRFKPPKIAFKGGLITGIDMIEAVLSLHADIGLVLDTAKRLSDPSLQHSLLVAAGTGATALKKLLPQEKPQRRYVLRPSIEEEAEPEAAPAKVTVGELRQAFKESKRAAYTPWDRKTSWDLFRSVILSYLRGAVPTRDHRENLAETAKLWSAYKEAPTVEEAIQCAKEAIQCANDDLRSTS